MGKTLGFENDLPYLDVRAAERPGLVIESRPPLVRIALGEATLAWFAPDRHWQYVAWLASPPSHSLGVFLGPDPWSFDPVPDPSRRSSIRS